MTKIEEETLALLGAFRAACEELANKWERHDPQGVSYALQLRALVAQTPMDLRGLAPKEKPGIIDVCVMIGVLCKDVVDLSKRIEKLEKVSLAPQEER